jgi:hypothetical protein
LSLEALAFGPSGAPDPDLLCISLLARRLLRDIGERFRREVAAAHPYRTIRGVCRAVTLDARRSVEPTWRALAS